MSKFKEIFRINAATPGAIEEEDDGFDDITQDDHREKIEIDKSILDEGKKDEKRLHREAEKRVTQAAEDSLTRLHIIKMGRCPECGEHLRRHLFASICESCGWHTFDVPRKGNVRVHLKDRSQPIDGDRCYKVRSGSLLVIKNELVVAKISREAMSWVEYIWSEDEIDLRHREVVENLDVQCGWCNQPADPEKDGFHLSHVALGTSQERYVFCSDDCYEAFRKMYPARVDRNCYERNCAECNLCVKRYDDEAEGIRVLAKDFLKTKRRVEQAAEARKES